MSPEMRQLLEVWSELRKRLDDVEPDLIKFIAGTAAAGARFRRTLRPVSQQVRVLVKESIRLQTTARKERQCRSKATST